MPDTPGVSDVHVIVVGTAVPRGSNSVAKSWSWNATGSGGSLGTRPPKMKVSTGGGGGPSSPSLQAPNVAGAGPCHVPVLSRLSERPRGVFAASATPTSVDVRPTAGPLLAANVPSYDRNSTTAPAASTRARPSGPPFWIPLL